MKQVNQTVMAGVSEKPYLCFVSMIFRILFVGSLLLPTLAGFAQKRVLKGAMFKDLAPSNAVVKSYGDSAVTFNTSGPNEDFYLNGTKRYFWFYQGEVKSTVGNYSGKLLHGPYEKHDRDGNLLEKGNFHYGLKTGTWVEWYRNGNLAGKYEWRRGDRNGRFETFFITGSKSSAGSYKTGKLNGKVFQYDVNGAETSKLKYRRGVLVKEKEKKVKDKKVKIKKAKDAGNTNDKPVDKKSKKNRKNNKTDGTPDVTAPVLTEEKTKRKKKSKDDQQINQPSSSTDQPSIGKKKKKKKSEAQPSSGQPPQPVNP